MTKKITTIGIIGGGQLGRMICFYAHKMGFNTVIFSDQENSPATLVTNKSIIANYNDKEALKEFVKLVDIVTFEFENIPFEALDFVAQHVTTYPSPQVLKTTQHRILEKDFLNSIGVKTADYVAIENLEQLQNALNNFGKAILKTATMGYDGKGQFVLNNNQEAAQAWELAQNQELILEKFCPFDSEISVMVARSTNNEVLAYEPLTNIHKDAILDESHYPARISANLAREAQEIAVKIAQEIGLIGVLAIEFFVIGQQLLVNELAPRPHNSGHFSMDGALTSQFEQLIRAINGFTLGSTKFHSKGYMKNIIGDEIHNLEPYYSNSKAKIHIYGKEQAKKGRKMAHINIIS